MENDLPSVNKYRKQLNKATADMDNYRIRYHTALKQMQQSSSSSGINGARAESLKKELEEATTKVDQCRVGFHHVNGICKTRLKIMFLSFLSGRSRGGDVRFAES